MDAKIANIMHELNSLKGKSNLDNQSEDEELVGEEIKENFRQMLIA